MTGDLDTAAGIAATDRITAAYGRVAGTQNTHRMEMRTMLLALRVDYEFSLS